ncbi:MAG: DNA alkylation repair protein [Beduini sp.]|uniref:DNA alkylation repair protein n=1 Tax=Beduini sp. TaxID=1922300 RepID=UPI0039A34C7F
MNGQEIILELQSMADEKYKANVVKMGIPKENGLGVSTGDIRKLAKKITKSNDTAEELWQTGYHEAKLLAVLLFDQKTTSLEEVEMLMKDVVSWDLCDHLCKNLIIKLPHYQSLIDRWVEAEETYQKRAAFTLIASSAIHEKQIEEDTLDRYLDYIKSYSQDDREHVKKAVSWALREIGKRDFDYNEKAILLAHELNAKGDLTQKWIAKDALKELENLVKVEGRKRLISSQSQMGKNKK